MQKQKDQVMQPVTMAILIAIVILSKLPSFSALRNSSSPPVSRGKPAPLVAETMRNTDEHQQLSNYVNIPVWGDVYSNGFYYVSIAIGDPPKAYNLDIDSGSDLTWLPEGLYESQSMRYEQSDYAIEYYDGTTSKGRVVTDTFTFQLRGGNFISHRLVIGRSAHYSSTGTSSSSTSHGMLGLGKGERSILSQLHEQGLFANIFGHCLSSDPEDSSFMFIGKDFDNSRCLTWMPMSSSHVSYYSLKMAEVVYGDEQLLGLNQDFVLDSGTSDTYFVDPLYQELLAKVAEMPLQKAREDAEYPDCWKDDTGPFMSIDDLRNRFSSLYLKLGDGGAVVIPPENYLIIMEDGDVCLAIFNGLSKDLNDFNLIGAISMQNVMIVYDNEQQQIGWACAVGCS